MARVGLKRAEAARAPDHNVRQSAESLASTLPPLLVAATHVASTVAQGVHGRRRVGVGETFWQFRQYMPGDTANRIDWRQSAKSERVYIRETEWEAAQSVWLWRDNSPSMQYHSSGAAETKAARATLLLLATAALLVRGGEHIALLGRDRVARSGRAALDRMTMSLIADGDQPATTDAATGLPQPARLPRYAHLVLLSDFLSPFEEIEAVVRRHAAQGVAGHLVHTLDPAEEDLPFSGRTRFEGMEQEGNITVGRAEILREEYQTRLAALRAGLTDLAHSVGWTFTGHRTDHPPQPALLSLYGAFARETV